MTLNGVKISDDQLDDWVKYAIKEGKSKNWLFFELKRKGIAIGEVRLSLRWYVYEGPTQKRP